MQAANRIDLQVFYLYSYISPYQLVGFGIETFYYYNGKHTVCTDNYISQLLNYSSA